MALYFFQISNGEYSGISDLDDIADRQAAWTEVTAVTSDLIGDAMRDLNEGAAWQIELLDQNRKPVFRVRLLAETIR